MILQALTQLYEDLCNQSSEERSIPKFGYSTVFVSGIAQIDVDGKLISIIPANSTDPLKKRAFNLPFQLKRSGSLPPAYFLSDNAQYVFGVEKGAVTEKSLKRFNVFKEFHENLLKDDTSTEAKALCNFLKYWDPQIDENKKKLDDAKTIIATGQIVFRILDTSTFLHDVPSILEKWEVYYKSTLSAVRGMCLVTGKNESIARIHNSVKNIKADSVQPNGWSLVSFDKDSFAFSSFGKLQGENAPVGEYAAFAYTAALNYLLADRENVYSIGDTTVVCWAEGADSAYNSAFGWCCFGKKQPEQITTIDLHATMHRLARGLPDEDIPFDLSRKFYILGLAPNAARLSVRFFYNSAFGELMKNIAIHHQRLEIVGSKYPFTSLQALVKSAIRMPVKNNDTTQKMPKEGNVLAGAIARAIFTGSFYPVSLIEMVMMRVRTDQDEKIDGKRIEGKVTPLRAAIIKAYYLKNTTELCPKEVLTVSLNEASTNIPYTLGRLFAVYEALQEAANPGINATIKDKYFNSASATPAVIFPILDNLAQKHLRKLTDGQKIYFDKQIGALKCILDETNPVRLTLPEQGSFSLGYYHQKQARYTKKEEK